jgi:phage-related tail protein
MNPLTRLPPTVTRQLQERSMIDLAVTANPALIDLAGRLDAAAVIGTMSEVQHAIRTPRSIASTVKDDQGQVKRATERNGNLEDQRVSPVERISCHPQVVAVR